MMYYAKFIRERSLCNIIVNFNLNITKKKKNDKVTITQANLENVKTHFH